MTELVPEFSSSAYLTDTPLSRLKRIPELNSRKGLCSKYWPLDVNENGVQLRSHHRNLTLHYFFCALSLGYNIENHGRKLFELCVADLVRVFGSGIVLPVGFPRSAGLPRTMTETVQLYARLSQLELRQV